MVGSASQEHAERYGIDEVELRRCYLEPVSKCSSPWSTPVSVDCVAQLGLTPALGLVRWAISEAMNPAAQLVAMVAGGANGEPG